MLITSWYITKYFDKRFLNKFLLRGHLRHKNWYYIFTRHATLKTVLVSFVGAVVLKRVLTTPYSIPFHILITFPFSADSRSNNVVLRDCQLAERKYIRSELDQCHMFPFQKKKIAYYGALLSFTYILCTGPLINCKLQFYLISDLLKKIIDITLK